MLNPQQMARLLRAIVAEEKIGGNPTACFLSASSSGPAAMDPVTSWRMNPRLSVRGILSDSTGASPVMLPRYRGNGSPVPRSRAPREACRRAEKIVAIKVLFLCLVAPTACKRSNPAPARSPNILLVVIDTLRADAVFGYGAPPSQTPTIATLAREGTLFTQARSTAAWTVPAHASLFTGRFPSRHGAHHEGHALAPEAVTLAELLSENYTTAGFSENPHLKKEKKFDQGFDLFRNTWPRRRRDRGRVPSTNRLALDWLDRQTGERPFFLFLNYMDPHLPYRPPHWLQARFVGQEVEPGKVEELAAFGDSEAREFVAGRLSLSARDLSILRQLYAAEAAFADRRLGEVIESLRSRGWLDQTLVILISDHGENIGDHGLMEHQFCLYESLLRVPLVLRLPGVIPASARRSDPVQLVDVFPTVLEAAGVPRSRWPEQEGRSLLGNSIAADRPVIAEYMLPHEQQKIFSREVPEFDFAPLMRRLRSIQIGSEKLIVADDGQFELYDLEQDPNERFDLAGERPERVRNLARHLAEWLDSGPSAYGLAETELSRETIESLRQLGYLD